MEVLENLFIDDLKKLVERYRSKNDRFLILRYDDAVKQIPHWYDGSRYLRYHNFDELKWAVNDYCDGLAESMLKHIKEEIEQDFLRLTMDRVLNDCVNLPHDITNNLDGKIRDGIKSGIDQYFRNRSESPQRMLTSLLKSEEVVRRPLGDVLQ
jgi:hypothetical protein